VDILHMQDHFRVDQLFEAGRINLDSIGTRGRLGRSYSPDARVTNKYAPFS
jgi:hypothetical protein